MELQFENKSIQYLRRNVREVKEQEQTQEVRLTDGMPDIGSILGVWGQCVMRSKEWNTDQFQVSGGVMAWVLYAPADGTQPRSVETWLPIQMKWNMPNSQRNGAIRCCWMLKSADSRMLSARKMMVRVNVSVLGETLENGEETVCSVSTPPEDVQVLKNTYPVRLPVETGEKTFLIDEEYTLSGSQTAEKLICCTASTEITEQKVLGDKVVFRGVCNLHMVYQGADGQIFSRDQEASFSQFAELDREYDKDARVEMTMVLSSMEPELQENQVRVKCGLVCQYLVSDMMMLELVEDAYSPNRSVSMECRELRLPMMLDFKQEPVRFECNIPESAAQIVDVTVNGEQPEIRRAGELAQVLCNGQVQVLYLDDNGTLQGRSGRWSGEWELPAADDAELLGSIQSLSRPQVAIGSGQINVNGDLQAAVGAVSRQPISIVTGLELGEAESPDPGRPSLILRRAGEGSLWEIAKKTGSTVTAIQKANGLSGEPLDDRLLLIPVV